MVRHHCDTHDGGVPVGFGSDPSSLTGLLSLPLSVGSGSSTPPGATARLVTVHDWLPSRPPGDGAVEARVVELR